MPIVQMEELDIQTLILLISVIVTASSLCIILVTYIPLYFLGEHARITYSQYVHISLFANFYISHVNHDLLSFANIGRLN